MSTTKKYLIAIAFGLIAFIVLATNAGANDDIKNALFDSGVSHIYISNREDGVADRITVFDAEGLAVACSLPGVTTVTFERADHTCEPN